jgi:hypothetical protein
MMPPECYICGKDLLPNEGGLIYFSEDKEDLLFNKRLEQPGYTGHPTNAFWFCKDHYIEAKKFSHLSKSEALKLIRKNLENADKNSE